MVIALLAAVITSFIVPPDEKYLDYFDYKTLACLFSVLAVVCALKNVQFFYILACNIVKKFRNIRLCTVVLVWVTFIGSMLIANDMALLTFLPLGYYVLHTAGKERYMAFTFIMQNIAANLGMIRRIWTAARATTSNSGPPSEIPRTFIFIQSSIFR